MSYSEQQRKEMFIEWNRINIEAMREAQSQGLSAMDEINYGVTKANNHIKRKYGVSIEELASIFQEGTSKWQHLRNDELFSNRASGKSEAKGCFIATACYGCYDAPEVLVLRCFRDESLLPSAFGRRIVALYYRASPRVARWLAKHQSMAATIRRFCLNPLTRFLARNGYAATIGK